MKLYNNEAEVLRDQIQLQALITEREGMIAENMRRERHQEAMAYDDLSFVQLAEKMRALLEDSK